MKKNTCYCFLLVILLTSCLSNNTSMYNGKKILFEDDFSGDNVYLARPVNWGWWNYTANTWVNDCNDAPEGYGSKVLSLGKNGSSTVHLGLNIDEMWEQEDYRVDVLWTDRMIFGEANDADFHIGIRCQKPEKETDDVELGYEVEIDGDTSDATNLMPEEGPTYFHLFTRGARTRVLKNASEDIFSCPKKDVWYWTSVEVSGNTLRAKIWENGTEEPDWMLETTDSESEFSSGSIRLGVWSGFAEVAYVRILEADPSDVCIATTTKEETLVNQSPWQSKLLGVSDSGALTYNPDKKGNYLLDYSYAGYRYGEELPHIAEKIRIKPGDGDDTQRIQEAIDEVGNLSLVDGFRGAVVLDPGEYKIEGTIKLNKSGVILRGSGSGDNPAEDTILYGIGNKPIDRSIIVAGSGVPHTFSDQVAGSTTEITTPFVEPGSLKFEVADANAYSKNDTIIIYHPCTEKWLKAIDGGGTASSANWRVGEVPIVYYRKISGIDGNTITLDAPLYYRLNKELAPCTISKYSGKFMEQNIGVENLRVDIIPLENSLTQHAKVAIDIMGVEDAWVKDCTLLHFQLSGVRTTAAVRVTIDGNKAIQPVQKVIAPWMYNFNAEAGSQLVLFSNNYASGGRHHYVVNGTSSASGIVFLRNTSSLANAPSEGHRRWSTGILYDNHVELDGPQAGMVPILLALYNRGDYGTSHGWAAVNSVAWNCDVAEGMLVAQQPPTGQNFAIGCSGDRITGSGVFEQPAGYIEGSNRKGLIPDSLYESQRAFRLQAE